MTIIDNSRPHPPTTDMVAGGPAEIVTLIPYLVGFQPSESVVLLMLRERRIVCTARFDLPASGDIDALLHWRDYIGAAADRQDADSAVVAVYTWQSGWADEVIEAMVTGELDVPLAIHYDELGSDQPDAGYGSFRVLNPFGVMEGPYGVDQRAERVAAEAVLAGMATLPSRESLAERIAPAAPERIDAVAAAAAEITLPETVQDSVVRMRQLVSQGVTGEGTVEVDDHVCAELGLLALDKEVRDAGWIAITAASAGRHLQLWSSVASRVPEILSAGPVCLAGMAAWISGNGALAWCCVDRAQQEHPGYTMASLLATILEDAVHPGLWEEHRVEIAKAYPDWPSAA